MFENHLLFPVQDQGEEQSGMAGKDGAGFQEGELEFGQGEGRREGPWVRPMMIGMGCGDQPGDRGIARGLLG